ncbi:MAG: hypothetical protein WDA20_04465 [Desulfuromonadales bacterium]
MGFAQGYQDRPYPGHRGLHHKFGGQGINHEQDPGRRSSSSLLEAASCGHTFPVAVADAPVTINQDLKALALKAEIDPKSVAFAWRTFSREILNQCSKQGTTVPVKALRAMPGAHVKRPGEIAWPFNFSGAGNGIRTRDLQLGNPITV